MRIGAVEITTLARLAPMAGITNAPFRMIARECGSGLTTTEEIDAAAYLAGTPHGDAIAAADPPEHPLAMQLLGSDPDLLVRAAVKLQDQGADIIDLNMGCPMPKITSRGKGAALMRDVPGTARILRALRRALVVPLTIKIRGGWDDTHLNAVEVARMAEAEGIDGITVHPRTSAQRFTGKAPWTIIAEAADAVRIPVTGNGDVRSMAEARRMMAETGCQSVMIGRGALGRPWVFSEALESLPPAARLTFKTRVIARHRNLIGEHFSGKHALIQMKRHLAWYTEGVGHATACRAQIFASRTVNDVWAVFQEYWERAAQPGPHPITTSVA
jgi:tRNA-dihydrouridine synthase B